MSTDEVISAAAAPVAVVFRLGCTRSVTESESFGRATAMVGSGFCFALASPLKPLLKQPLSLI